jgi:dUTP pyrophosphatase
VLAISTGLALEIPEDWTGLVFPRSGLGTKHGIILANGTGVIDPDYRGELIVQLFNRSNTPYEVRSGDRVAQLVLVPRYTPEIELVEVLSETERNTGGFGSTGN